MRGFEDRIAMSQKERDVLKVVQSVADGQRSQAEAARLLDLDRKSTRLNSSHIQKSRMPSSA